jgi:type IV pilus assembly protein PilC
MKISYVFENYWYLIIMWMILFVMWIFIWKKTPSWKYNFDMFMIKMPIFWEIVKKIILSKFSRILSGLLGSWVSIIESLRITSDAVWNEVYRQRILLLMEDVKKWMKIWESIDGDPLFPAIMIQMIQVWEQTAKLDSIILKIADFYDEQVDVKIWVINKLLEPIIIVILAIIVWFIAISIMEPIMQLADQASSK